MAGRQPQRRAIVCAYCGALNVINEWHRVTEEFSVRCRSCERRAIYRVADIRPLETAEASVPPQRRHAAMFGLKRRA